MTDTPDPLDALLAPPPAADDDGLKQAVFARTTRVLRRLWFQLVQRPVQSPPLLRRRLRLRLVLRRL